MDDFERRRKELITSALSHISKSANLCKHYLDDNEIPTALEELNECVKGYCKQDLSFSTFKKALNLTENEYKDAENAPDDPVENTFKKLHAKEVPSVTEEMISQHPFMVQYIRDIEEELEKEVGNRDDDIITADDFTPPIDPITKTAIKNPVRNTQCGHIYEQESITTLIKKKNTRCPYIGCPAFQYIQLSYLKSDHKLKKKIDHYFLNN